MSNKLKLYSLVLVSGAITMVFELIMPRIFAPYLGTSTYVWTIIIGVVMASLSLGYFVGGHLSRGKSLHSTLVTIYLVAFIHSFFVYLTKDLNLYTAMTYHGNILTLAWMAAFILLAPLTFLLGTITPISIKLLLGNGEVGAVSGNVYALSTIGSLIGTFSTGFWLIPHFSLSNLLLSISLILLLCASALVRSYAKKIILVIVALLLSSLYTSSGPNLIFRDFYEKYSKTKLVIDLNTHYNRVWIYDQTQLDGSVERVMSDSQSTIILNRPIQSTMEDRLSYYAYFNLFSPHANAQSVLMIGGGAYTYANYLQAKYPHLAIDVVEIDPELLTIAEKYFNFKPGKNFHNYTMDGRNFLNTNTKKYDVIFLDAYQNGAATPFQLITQQAMVKLNHSLTDEGQLYVNVISSLAGKSSPLLLSEYKTMRSVFGSVQVFPVFTPNPTTRQNLVLLGTKSALNFSSLPAGLNQPISNVEQYLGNQKLLTDDFAPVEYYDLQGIL